MAKSWLLLFTLFVLAGCRSGPPMGREKLEATEEEYTQARYVCMKEATGRYSEATVSGYSGAATSQPEISCQLYDACMQSKGFNLVPNGRFQSPIRCTRK